MNINKLIAVTAVALLIGGSVNQGMAPSGSGGATVTTRSSSTSG
jgi:hypothetical protein